MALASWTSRYVFVVVAEFYGTLITSGLTWSYTSPGAAAPITYTPCGPQTAVDVSVPAAGGWSSCYSNRYANSSVSLATILTLCNRASLMLACRPAGASAYTCTLLAWAPRADVLMVADMYNALDFIHLHRLQVVP